MFKVEFFAPSDLVRDHARFAVLAVVTDNHIGTIGLANDLVMTVLSAHPGQPVSAIPGTLPDPIRVKILVQEMTLFLDRELAR